MPKTKTNPVGKNQWEGDEGGEVGVGGHVHVIPRKDTGQMQSRAGTKNQRTTSMDSLPIVSFMKFTCISLHLFSRWVGPICGI